MPRSTTSRRPAPIALAWEPIDALLDSGLERLVAEHWREVGVHKRQVPLACDWERYRQLEQAGVMQILAARRAGRLIGYNSFVVAPHLHYRTTVHALGDAIFVPKRLRSTGVGLRLVDQAEHDLAARHPGRHVRIIYHDKLSPGLLGPVLKRRGYEAFETMWQKLVRAD